MLCHSLQGQQCRPIPRNTLPFPPSSNSSSASATSMKLLTRYICLLQRRNSYSVYTYLPTYLPTLFLIPRAIIYSKANSLNQILSYLLFCQCSSLLRRFISLSILLQLRLALGFTWSVMRIKKFL